MYPVLITVLSKRALHSQSRLLLETEVQECFRGGEKSSPSFLCFCQKVQIRGDALNSPGGGVGSGGAPPQELLHRLSLWSIKLAEPMQTCSSLQNPQGRWLCTRCQCDMSMTRTTNSRNQKGPLLSDGQAAPSADQGPGAGSMRASWTHPAGSPALPRPGLGHV